MTEHADAEAVEDGFDIYGVERGILTGRIKKTWKRDNKHEIIGTALNGRKIGIVCRITATGKIRIITVKEISMGFWDGETCEYCDGAIVEKRITLHRKVNARYVLLEDVPAGVCT